MVVFLSFVCFFISFRLFVVFTLFVVCCRQEWVRVPVSSRLTRNTFLPLHPEPVMASLQDRFYPIRTSLPSCIKLPEGNRNNFELKPQFINTFPKFHDLESEDAYFFVRKVEEVCLMMRIPQLIIDKVGISSPFLSPKIISKCTHTIPSLS